MPADFLNDELIFFSKSLFGFIQPNVTEEFRSHIGEAAVSATKVKVFCNLD